MKFEIINPLYHATRSEFDTFKTPAHFGTEEAAEDIAGFSPYSKIIKAYVDIKNPIRLIDDQIREWSLSTVEGSLLHNYKIPKQEIKEYRDKYGDVQGMIKLLAKYGYDGIVYENQYEDVGSDSFIVFYPEQIKIVK